MLVILIREALRCRCPRCGVGRLYDSGLNWDVRPICDHCGLHLARNDSADGPAVFLIFVLGFLLVPLAVWVDFLLHPPLWMHAVLWGAVALGLTLGSLKPLKSLVMHIQYRTRPETWEG